MAPLFDNQSAGCKPVITEDVFDLSLSIIWSAVNPQDCTTFAGSCYPGYYNETSATLKWPLILGQNCGKLGIIW